ncbi:MAG: diacylglycerol kinase family protein [Vicinamibacterales bacterium]
MSAGVIINPIAGTHARFSVGARIQLARDVLERCGIEGQVTVTERRDHGRELAAALVAEGVDTLVVWGGDGSVNEVASEVAFRGPVLGIVPAGSGNGLARELHLEWDPARALETALTGRPRRIDAGELGGRLFFNVAGVGIDAHLAAAFNALSHRGGLAYFQTAWREVARYEPRVYTVRAGELEVTEPALAIAVANTRQYGNRAIIAPLARPDDGLLELVMLPPLSPLAILWQARRLFTGSVHRVPGVRMHSVREVEIVADGPLAFHVDGEAATGHNTLSAKVHPHALQVRVPAS